jgi:hypothetical protein
MNIYRRLKSTGKWITHDTGLKAEHAANKARTISKTEYPNSLLAVGTDSPDKQMPECYYHNGRYIANDEAFYVKV